MRPHIIALFALTSFLSTSCTNKRIEHKKQPGYFPVKEIDFFNATIRISPSENTNLSDYINLGMFGDLNPSMLKTPEPLFAAATRMREEFDYIAYEYWSDSNRIELWKSKKEKGKPLLISYPRRLESSKIIIPEIHKLITDKWYESHKGKNPIIMILDHNSEIAVEVYLNNDIINYIEWTKEF
ncbi:MULTISPECIES: hypothetical protein [Niastella]|uniref:Lipoprotein n=1 Tax=Niastella soli TaxID=2821487 RepID=A0ABS3YQR7_9BACT|nr:hypothetical protein [Niastella soli]MBO9200223.1 hypothetical protein [Niastella soli]